MSPTKQGFHLLILLLTCTYIFLVVVCYSLSCGNVGYESHRPLELELDFPSDLLKSEKSARLDTQHSSSDHIHLGSKFHSQAKRAVDSRMIRGLYLKLCSSPLGFCCFLAPSFFHPFLKTKACLSGPVLNILKC